MPIPYTRPDSEEQAVAAASAGETLPRELLSRDPRARLLAGALQEVTKRGYPATTVAMIVEAAGVSRKTFYEYFANKQECVLASYDLVVDWLGRRIAAAVVAETTWARALRAAVTTTLAAFAAEPRLAAFCAVEIQRVDRAGFGRHEASLERLADALHSGRAHRRGRELPAQLEQTILGGAIWLVGNRVRLGEADRLAELAPDITYFLLVPYLDIPAAQRAIAGIS